MKLTLDLGSRSYDIILKRGALRRAGQLTNLTGRVMLVTDDGVPQKYVKALAAQCGRAILHVLPRGEVNKTPGHVQNIHSHMLAEGFCGGDVVAALGGGAVGDVAGYAAATYMRGVGLCLFPTTVAAQAGGAVGGMWMLNLDGRKNVLGTLYQPGIVVADPDVLKTLAPRQVSSGFGSILGMGLAAAPDLLEMLEADDPLQDAERLLYTGLLCTKELVQCDEAGLGERNFLYLGHTIGNAIEAAGRFETLLHGECVALGFLPMLESRTLLRRARAIMRRHALPLKHSCPIDTVLEQLKGSPWQQDGRYAAVRVKTAGQAYVELLTYEELRLLAGGADEKN